MWLAAAAAAAAAAGRSCSQRVPLSVRSYSYDAAEALMREYAAGRPPQVVPFQITESQARDKFLAWQRGTARLAPSSLLPPGGPWHMRAALLPFWLFDVRARIEYAGSVGLRDKEGGSMTWRDVGWRELPQREYSWQQDRQLQVYASYKYRRDYVAAVHGPWALKHLQLLPEAEARRGGCAAAGAAPGRWPGAELDPPAMRQGIAWEFVLRDVREAEQRAAEQRLLAAHGAQETRDVHVRLHALEHSARLAFLPAFHLQYEHGEAFNAHGERVPARYEALISGTAEGGVAGTRHYSAHKAGGGVLLGAMAATAAAAPLLGMDPWGLINVESAFMLLSAASLAGVGTRMVPTWLHQVAEEERLRASDAEFDRVVSMGMGPRDTGTEQQEFLRSAAEWRRWEAVGAEPWREHKRQLWAEELFASQQRRRLEREQLRERLQWERARQEEEERREQRRQQRWGRSHHAHHWQQQEAAFAGGRSSGGRRDYLHYYRLLGLEAAHERGHVTQEDIKRAFRRAALRWHPDKQEVADEQGRRAARERFQQVRTAYEVLRDPDRRRAYDRGETVEM